MNQGLEISSTSLFLCEMSSKCFEIIILFLLHIIRVILSKPCHMFDKRGLGNSRQTDHIIESVLVVAAFQISPAHEQGPMFWLSQLTTNKCPSLVLDRSACMFLLISSRCNKHTACGWIWAHKDFEI